MSYQWIDVSTAEGRERLKELVERGDGVIVCTWPMSLAAVCKHKGKYMWGDFEYSSFDGMMNDRKGPQFLDPGQDSEIAALKAENKQLLKACQDSASKEVVDKVLHDRQVSELLAEIDRLKKLL